MISSAAMGGCSVGAPDRVGIRTISGGLGGVCGPDGSCASRRGTETPEATIVRSRDVKARMMRFGVTICKMHRSGGAVSSNRTHDGPHYIRWRPVMRLPYALSVGSLKFSAAALVEFRCATKSTPGRQCGRKSTPNDFSFRARYKAWAIDTSPWTPLNR